MEDFFAGMTLEKVEIPKRNGRATGEGYATFGTEEAAQEALQRFNKQSMGHRYIELFVMTEKDGDARKRGGGREKEIGCVVRIRGLPYSSTEAEVLAFFEGFSVVENGVLLTTTPEGRSTGGGFVEFHSEEDCKEALTRNMGQMGSRYIEVFPSTKSDMAKAAQRMLDGTQQRSQYSQPEWAAVTDGSVLKLRGLPFSATDEDVQEFFAGFGVSDIHLVRRPEREGKGASTGLAYVKFESPAEAAQAKTACHRASMGSRYIECMIHTGGHRANGKHPGGGAPMPQGHQEPVLANGGPAMGHGYGQNKSVPAWNMGLSQQQVIMQQQYMMHQQMIQHQAALQYQDPGAYSNLGQIGQQAPAPAQQRGDLEGGNPWHGKAGYGAPQPQQQQVAQMGMGGGWLNQGSQPYQPGAMAGQMYGEANGAHVDQASMGGVRS